MLTIAECRELIEDSSSYSDEEIVKIRDELYELATLALEVWEKKRISSDA